MLRNEQEQNYTSESNLIATAAFVTIITKLQDVLVNNEIVEVI